MTNNYKYDLKTMGVIWVNEGQEPATMLLDKKFGPSAKGNFTWAVQHNGQWKKLIANPVLSEKLDNIGPGKYATVCQPSKNYYEVTPSGGLGEMVKNIPQPATAPEPAPVQGTTPQPPVQPPQEYPTYEYQNGPAPTPIPDVDYPVNNPIPFDEDMQRLSTQEQKTETTNVQASSKVDGPVSDEEKMWYDKEIRDIRQRALANIFQGFSQTDTWKTNPSGHLDALTTNMNVLLGRWMDMVVNGSSLEQKPAKMVIINQIIKYIPRPMSFESIKDLENTCSRIASEILCRPYNIDIPQPEDFQVRDSLLDLPINVLEAILDFYKRG